MQFYRSFSILWSLILILSLCACLSANKETNDDPPSGVETITPEPTEPTDPVKTIPEEKDQGTVETKPPKDAEKDKPTTPKSGQSEKGILLYAIPDSMKVGQASIAEVRIARSLKVENIKRLKKRLKEDVKAQTDTVLTGEIMDIELSEHDTTDRKFKIIPRQNSEQILEKDEIGYWSWSVIPQVAGRHALIVRVGIKQYSEKFKTEGYRYIPVWEQEIEVESSGELIGASRPTEIPTSYGDDKTITKRIETGPTEKIKPPKKSFPWVPVLSMVGILLIIGIFLIRKRKSGPLVKPPPISRAALNAIDDLIKKDQLETALEKLELLVKTVRDNEHNQLISYEAELEGYEKKYKGGEIKYDEYARVRARIRRALIEMNDRLMES